jgi:hypothetical protein
MRCDHIALRSHTARAEMLFSEGRARRLCARGQAVAPPRSNAGDFARAFVENA